IVFYILIYRGGCGGRDRGYGRGSAAIYARGHPLGAITSRRTGRKHSEDEFHILACQGTEVDIRLIYLTLVAFEERTPQRFDGIATRLIIESERDIAVRGTAFTTDRGLEAITALHFERRIEALDVAILNILREGDQPAACIGGTRLEFCIAHFQHKAFGITICAGAWQLTRSAKPCT